jgi:putative transposase
MNSVSSELKSLSHSKGQNWYHVILVPRARCPVFRFEATRKLCQEGIEQVCKRHKIDLFTHEVMPDHVHLFISCPARRSILKMCAIIKGGTSHYIRSAMPSLRRYPRLWSRGIFFRSVGNVSAEAVKNYIDNSKGNQWRRTREMQTTLF